ncbi:ADP-ribosyltransferase [Vibrio sp. SSH13-20]|uniref:ADP-ribosyltransferase n=1 Tax=Vibrio sp. SSH13-20 TaxID=3136668 RepID=UPI0032C41EAA
MQRVIGKEMYEQLAAELGIEESELYKTRTNHLVAIRNYTYRRFTDINGLIRSGQTNEKHQIAVELLVQALENLPVYEGLFVIRWTNLSPEHLELVSEEGNLIQEPSFTSTSRDAGFYLSGCAHRLLIKHYNGRYIAPWSFYDDDEEEVLIPPQAVFRTKGYSEEHRSFLLEQLSEEEVESLTEQDTQVPVVEEVLDGGEE